MAPDQKYCERHSHKSRPRSRKPVELPAHRGHNSNIHQSVNNTTLNKSYPKYMASSIASSEQQPPPPPPPRLVGISINGVFVFCFDFYGSVNHILML